MTNAIKILQVVLVNYFYKVNSGLFLFLFFVLFGAPYSPLQFHASLINGIIQSQLFLGIVMLLWMLYNLKGVDYILKQLDNPRQTFLFCLNNLPVKSIYLLMLYVQVLVYLPALLYSSVIIWFAVKNNYIICAVEIVVFNLIVIASTALLYVAAIQKKQLFKSQSLFPSIKINLPKPLLFIPLYFIWHQRKQMLFITKTFSLLVLYGFIKLYEPERHDIRPLQLCLLVVAASHSAIIFEIRSFEEEYLSFSKILPITITTRFLRLMIMFACLLLPELVLLFKGCNIHFSIVDYPQLLLMPVALLCMFYVALILEDTNMEQLIRVVFGILAACFFILLYNPGLMLPFAIILLAFVLYNSYYYHFEKKVL